MKIKIISLSLILLITSKVAALAPPTGVENTAKAEKLKEKLNSGEFSLSSFAFTENKGQVYGYDGLAHPEVKFVFQQAGTQIFLLEKGIAYQFTNMHYPEGYQELMRDKYAAVDKFEKIQELQKLIRIETYRMDMTLAGANQYAKITTEGRSVDYTNFYTRNVLDVHTFSKITYHEIYPGIDWVIYSKNNQIKYDFVVKPGADPSIIKMEFTHQEDLSLNKDGSFTLKNSMGSITEKSPESFQNGERIETKFILKNNRLSFGVADYSRTEKLIIDPAIIWATYYGGSLTDYGSTTSFDYLGNVYLSGLTQSNNNISFLGYQNNLNGLSDVFLVKFNGGGVRQWGTYFGGIQDEYCRNSCSDRSGNIYLTGSTNSILNFSYGGHQNTYGGGSSDAFLVKFDTSGILKWATYYGGENFDEGRGIACDTFGNVFLSGITQSSLNIASIGHQNIFGGGIQDAFLVKFSSAGMRQWSTYYGEQGSDAALGCNTDFLGNIFITGSTSSTMNIASGGHQNTNISGAARGFLVKFNSSGIRQFGTYYGGNLGYAIGTSCVIDKFDNIYMAGVTDASDSIASGGHQNTIGSPLTDAFLVKFNNNGVRLWATYYGGNRADYCGKVVSDQNGNVYISGITESTTNIASGGYQNLNAGNFDAYFVKFNSLGTRIWGSYFGGELQEPGDAYINCNNGFIYLSGTTASSLLATSGAHQNNNYLFDAFLVKFCDNNPSQPSLISGSLSICNGDIQNYSVTIDPNTTSYVWTLPGGWTGSSNSNTIFVKPISTGVMTVVSQNTCGASLSQTLNVTVNSCVGIDQLEESEKVFSVYPNPNSGEFIIKSSQKLNISIYTALGQLILKESLTEGKNKINLGNQPSGIYFVQSENNLDRIKLIKQ